MNITRAAAAKWLSVLAVVLSSSLTWAAGVDQKKADDAAMDFFMGEPASMVYPAPAPLLTNAQGREYQSLNGAWDILMDEAGMSWRVITAGDYLTDNTQYPDTGWNLLEHGFDQRNQLQVPGDWNSQRPELDRYRSRILYYKAVNLKPQQGKRYLMHFGGANYTTDLFVNDKLVGRHIGGYTAFNFDVTDFLKPGKNRFIVRVDAHLDETTIPTMRTSDFWKYGGLTRDVGLITIPESHVSQYHIYLEDAQQGLVKGWVKLEGGQVAGREVEVAIKGAGIKTAVTTNEEGLGEFAVKASNLKLWSPENPYLYKVALSFGKERIKDRIGLRTVATRGTDILLNGKPVKLRGISMHEETVLHAGLSNSRKDVAAMFKLVKELNANFVRLAHYPHNEHTVKLADEMGIMLWSEVPIVSMIDWENPQTLAAAKSQVQDNVARDMNRASIIFWSVSNESFPQTQARLDFLTELVTTARAMDHSGRPIASALVGSHEEFAGIGRRLFEYLLNSPDTPQEAREGLMAMAAKMQSAGNGATPQKAEDKSAVSEAPVFDVVINDKLGEVVDIIGYNEYFGWYYSKFFAQSFHVDEGLMRNAMLEVMSEIRFSNAFGKPMIISEFGAGAKQGLHSDKALIWSEEYQAKVYRAQLDMLEKSPQVQGYSPWVLKDFRSHLRELNGIQDTYNRKGLVSETGEKKIAFDVLSEFYRQKKAAQ
ncbi:beta-glucuronidase [Aestuariicella hydrocarbonica]|uniref:Beta-glucuronidase n=1 Tax=Pseudomaricurvus hydrocarbonicus TaxID=1470433 RepID=A0A9E5JWZ6_9GAMM|nr:glycoside hydrolase family 2 TIM barrel-domain containing protein [Aestuariicella hydrocarbonica]NHO66030.1 beta-glucuronidase [Aestuariicella hydrocarbonica]